MSKFEKLNVDIRKEQGTSAARRTRLQNKVPAVVYHSGVEATPLSVDKISLNKALRTGQMIFEVNVEDKDQFVLVKEIQYHPVTCLLYTSPSPRDFEASRMPSSA